MSSNDAGMSDEVAAEVNPDSEHRYTKRPGAVMQQPERIPDRPADGAAKAKWVDYCVALGADRTFLTEDTDHGTGGDERTTVPAFAREQLIELADRLGG